MLHTRYAALLAVLALAGCKSPDSVVSSDVSVDCPQVLNQSRDAGVDYVPTLRAAARGDGKALSQLLELTGSDHLDASAQQCHVEALAELLTRLGDSRFAQALANESAEVRRAVVSGLIIELDNLPTAEQSRQAFADRYPHTAAQSGSSGPGLRN